jgi:ribosomal protein S18 acetylase RimI-like enzyme
MSSFHLSNLLSFGLEPRPMLRLRLPQDRDAPIRVRRVQSWRDQYYFTRLPWLIYENDPYWVPPLLIEGFQYPPRIMMNHNPPYYAELCESWGLQKAKDLYAWWFVKDNENLRCWMQRVRRFQERSHIKIRPFNLSNFEAEMARCVEVYTVTRYDQWGFIDLTPAELRYFAKRLAQFARPDLVLVAEDNGKAVGFSITVPDLNEAIRPLNGRLTSWGMPIGAVRLFQRLKQVKTARVMVLGVVPGYRHRGIAELMILQTIERGIRDAGFESAELSWTLEDNHAINNTIQAVGGKLYKRYRIYEKCIAE